jgi:hypothetical protein
MRGFKVGQRIVSAGLFLAACLSGARGAQAYLVDPALFSTPTCNTELAVAQLEQDLRSLPETNSDGHVPWPKLSGFWVNPRRDLVVRVRFIDDRNFHVNFYSLCSRSLWATGFGKMPDKPTEQPLVVDMVTSSRGYDKVTVFILPAKDGRTADVKVQGMDAAQPSSPIPFRDDFKAHRLILTLKKM